MASYDFLKRTSRKGKSGHRHMVYLQGEMGYSSTDSGHSHMVIRDETGEFVLLEEDGHTHELADLEFDEVTVPQDEEETVVAECLHMLRTAEDLESKFREDAKRAEDFSYGEQWSDKDRRKVEAEDRPALTYNEIEPKLDLLVGYQSKNRTDIKFLPTEGGDAKVADLLTILVKNICEQSNYEVEETSLFTDMAITGRGFLDVDVVYDRNYEGEIKIISSGWDSCYLGPHKRKEADDLEFLVKDKWLSLAKLKQLWPEKAKKISAKYWPAKEPEQPYISTPGDEYGTGDVSTEDLSPTLVDVEKKEFRVLEVWRKEYSRVIVVTDPENDVFISTDGWSESEIRQIKSIPVLTSVERMVTRSRVTKLAGGVILEDEYSDLFDGIFQTLPVYAKKRGNRVWGKVKPLIDPQLEIDKRRSQIADILNKVAAYGWFYDGETFENETDENKFRKNSARPGFTQKVADSGRPPVKVEGVKFPSELAAFEEISSRKMNEISNVNLELLGLSSNAQSGVAIAERKRAGLVGNEFLFDAVSSAKKQLGRILVKLIQKVYTPERILRVVQSQIKRDPEQAGSIGGMPFEQYQEADLLALLETDDLVQYDVVVTENPHSATARQAAFFVWAELAAQGAPIPMAYLAEISDAPHKEKLIQGIMEMQQAEAQAEQAKHQTEIVKTMIAKKGDKGGGDTGK